MTAVHRQDLRRQARHEPAIATQEVYTSLDPVVQAVLTDKNANIDQLLTEPTPRRSAPSTRLADPHRSNDNPRCGPRADRGTPGTPPRTQDPNVD